MAPFWMILERIRSYSSCLPTARGAQALQVLHTPRQQPKIAQKYRSAYLDPRADTLQAPIFDPGVFGDPLMERADGGLGAGSLARALTWC